jgi:hypothetical protein
MTSPLSRHLSTEELRALLHAHTHRSASAAHWGIDLLNRLVRRRYLVHMAAHPWQYTLTPRGRLRVLQALGRGPSRRLK